MKNFLIATGMDVIIFLVSFVLFKNIISGPTRHRIYEKFMSSFAKFIIYVFAASVIITSITALVLYKTRFIAYLNIIAPSLVSILIGFIASTVPTRGIEAKKKEKP